MKGGATLGKEARDALGGLATTYVQHRPLWDGVQVPVGVLDAEVLRVGRPGLIDVVVDTGGRLAHLVVGLRVPGDEAHFLPGSSDAVLGLFEDGEGLAVAVDAMRDAELATLLLREVLGELVEVKHVRPAPSEEGCTALVFDDRFDLRVFEVLSVAVHPALELLLALDEAGFNHLAAPLAIWRRDRTDLGVVQEHLVGATSGSAVAFTSVRDLYASGGPPERAGGDFATEAQALGTMTARMHLALDAAFGRTRLDPRQWAYTIQRRLAEGGGSFAGSDEVLSLLGDLGDVSVPCHAIRVHSDYHLDRVERVEQGWYLTGFAPVDSASRQQVSPLVDVARMLRSFGAVASVGASERGPSEERRPQKLMSAWERRNRRAFISAYRAVPGIAGLVPPRADAFRTLLSAAEVELATRDSPQDSFS